MNTNPLFTVVWFHSLAAFLPLSMIILYKKPSLWLPLLSIFLGIITGILDLHSDEVEFTALLLLVFGFFLGFQHSKHAWRWALLIGIWVPSFQIGGILLFSPGGMFLNEGIGSLLALIPAFLGTYAGVLIRNGVNRRENISSVPEA